MKSMWYMGSYSDGREGDWTDVDQIQGQQTFLKQELFGIHLRIINNDTFYSVGDVNLLGNARGFREFEDEKLAARARKKIKEVAEMSWSRAAVEELLKHGIVRGVCKQLEENDKECGTNKKEAFLQSEGITEMLEIEERAYSKISLDDISAAINAKRGRDYVQE